MNGFTIGFALLVFGIFMIYLNRPKMTDEEEFRNKLREKMDA